MENSAPEWPLPAESQESLSASPARAADGPIQAIVASGAAGAFNQRRIEQLLRFGHSPDSDQERPLAHLPHKAIKYLADACDLLGHSDGSTVEADRIGFALIKIEKAGALVMSAFDILSAQVANNKPAGARGRGGLNAATGGDGRFPETDIDSPGSRQ
jgi:hypothetical protein